MDLDAIAAAARPFTMVCDAGVRFTAQRAVDVIAANVPGDLVECGVWRGGCSLAMLLAQRAAFGVVRRPVHMLDSFAGLPAADVRDGPAALSWQADTQVAAYRDNCRADRAGVEAMLLRAGFGAAECVIWPGPFAATLAPLAASVPGIALLRIDCDWYASVRPCLELLVPRVSAGGVVILDDYFAWDGCARAVHDYLAATDQPFRITSLPDRSAAYFVKGGP